MTARETPLDLDAWVTENSCWTCQPSRHPLRTTEIEKHPFAVDEADDPLLEHAWPFLLIVRTGRIVTAHMAPSSEEV